MTTALEIEDLSVGYARKGLALEGVSLSIPAGGVVALLGANGAGKTTLIRAVTGLLDVHHGRVASGGVRFEGQSILHLPAHRRVRMGIGLVPEGRLIFKHLTVEENLRVGAAALSTAQRLEGLEAVYTLFPRLRERHRQAAGWMSGGEQQMLALGRAIIARPRLLLVDELSLGLAPLVVGFIYEQLRTIGQTLGTAMLVVEQNAKLALGFAQTAYLLDRGRLTFAGPAAELAASESMASSYLGTSSADATRSATPGANPTVSTHGAEAP